MKDKIRVEDLARKFGLMSINQMASYHTLMETYKIVHFNSSDKLREKLVPKSENSKSLNVPLVKRVSCRGFSFYAARIWNELPADIRSQEKPHQSVTVDEKRVGQFKAKIKKWIWDGGVPFK